MRPMGVAQASKLERIHRMVDRGVQIEFRGRREVVM
jgi:hypothetical protein